MLGNPVVAFTPKGGCPLKHALYRDPVKPEPVCSIHPQGWVPVETVEFHDVADAIVFVAFTPKGGCPLKL